jgi:hypothetical protein
VAGDEQAKRATLDFDEFISALPATLAIAGVLVYGVLIVAYSEFYAELGVRPAEVGLEFGPGLGGLAGVAIILIVLVALSTALTLLCVRFFGQALPELKRIRLLLLGLNVIAVSAVLLVAFSQLANDQADNAKDGSPVQPFRLLGLEILPFRADLARVELADPKAAEADVYEEVEGADKLFYLGRADGAVVLYEPGRQSSWRLPASAFAVRTLNCETTKPNRDPACPD